jgi:hypothetical protein
VPCNVVLWWLALQAKFLYRRLGTEVEERMRTRYSLVEHGTDSHASSPVRGAGAGSGGGGFGAADEGSMVRTLVHSAPQHQHFPLCCTWLLLRALGRHGWVSVLPVSDGCGVVPGGVVPGVVVSGVAVSGVGRVLCLVLVLRCLALAGW